MNPGFLFLNIFILRLTMIKEIIGKDILKTISVSINIQALFSFYFQREGVFYQDGTYKFQYLRHSASGNIQHLTKFITFHR